MSTDNSDNEWSDANYKDLLRKFQNMTAQRDDLIHALIAVAKNLGLEDWTAICEDPSVVLIQRDRLVTALAALRTHDSAGGPCDVPGLKCECIAKADAAMAEAKGP